MLLFLPPTQSHSASFLPSYNEVQTGQVASGSGSGSAHADADAAAGRLTVPPVTPTLAAERALRRNASLKESGVVKVQDDDVLGFIDDSKAQTPFAASDRDIFLGRYFMRSSPSNARMIYARLGVDLPAQSPAPSNKLVLYF